ncbi:nuclear transport factor 2 family protein [Mucilaginibacter pedocola]|uniref:SnoaL-like domain-containing protein n=1 Tax=Mucilaginibacter pedocola TaxID=1792845 RepID=A0A1S9PM74_9SPHI|nr:nuclear transport factor 2 family protein [Mucilaginibacter pedocola]OOQ62045.1 hypothetical protein BC343_03060 [Mucilaginibacter pedocola]
MMESIRDIVKSINKAFETNEMDKFVGHCADDVVWNMIGHVLLNGKQAILDFMKDAPAGCEPILHEDVIVVDGNNAACTGSMEMKNPDGSPYKGRFCDVYKFVNGKVQTMDSYIIEIKE